MKPRAPGEERGRSPRPVKLEEEVAPYAERTDFDRKEVIKQAIDEWLERKYAEVGKWTLRGIVALAVGVICYVAATKAGWIPPHP